MTGHRHSHGPAPATSRHIRIVTSVLIPAAVAALVADPGPAVPALPAVHAGPVAHRRR